LGGRVSGTEWPPQVCKGFGRGGDSGVRKSDSGWKRGVWFACYEICHFIALDSNVGLNFKQCDRAPCSTSLVQSCGNVIQHVLMQVMCVKVGADQHFVDLKEATEAICQNVNVLMVGKAL